MEEILKQQPPELPLSPPPSNYNHKYFRGNWKKMLFLLILIDAIIFGAFYYFVLSKQTTPPKSKSINKATPSPSISTYSTANWRIYTNQKYHFSMRIPPLLIHIGFKENINKNSTFGIQLADQDFFYQGAENQIQGAYEGPNLNMLIYPEKENSEYVLLKYEKSPTDVMSTISIAGISAVKKFNPIEGTSIYFERNGYIYEFNIFSQGTQKEKDFAEIYQILSTFKFTK